MKKSFFAVAFISIALLQSCSGSQDSKPDAESEEEPAPAEEMRRMDNIQPSAIPDSTTEDITINEEGVK